MQPLVAVIDADPAVQQTLRALLSALNAKVEFHDNAETYLRRKGVAPACIVMDAHLPGMTGLELLRQLRTTEIDANRNVPVILLADEPDVPLAVEAMRLGAVDFIEKSRMDVALLRRVSQLLHNGGASAAQKNTVRR